VEKDLVRLSRLPKHNAEYDLVRSYLEFCAALPWNKSSNDHISLSAAKKQLEDDHCGLEPVKRRIIEFLAVLKMCVMFVFVISVQY
jgi:ATP-dependent Lon protease